MTQRTGEDGRPAGLKELWARGGTANGLWSSLADPVAAELLGRRGFDYFCIDLQHGFAGPETLIPLLQALGGTATEPIVRVAWNDPATIMRALDTGAAGVIVPMVNTADDARAAVAACRYPPLGLRSWGPARANVVGGPYTPGAANHDVICAVMAETAQALENLEEIVAVPGVDAVYVGPNDLAMSIGQGRATYRDSPEVRASIGRVLEVCRRHGVVAGLHCSSPEMALEWRAAGFQMLTIATDLSLLRAAAHDVVQAMNT